MDRILKKQLKRIEKQEEKIVNKKDNTFYKSNIDPLVNKITEKIPEKLKTSLEDAFYKGFSLIFEKGHEYIEKTYNREKKELDYDANNYAVDRKLSNKFIRKLDRKANQSRAFNSSLSLLEGGVLGVLGIGLPDIPVFIGMIIRTVYEVALSYGYEYEKEEEKLFVLLIVCGAISDKNDRGFYNDKIDSLSSALANNQRIDINLEEQMKETSILLSDAMLATKFIQGIPIVGAIGGIANYNIIKKIGRYAAVKYKKRYMLSKIK